MSRRQMLGGAGIALILISFLWRSSETLPELILVTSPAGVALLLMQFYGRNRVIASAVALVVCILLTLNWQNQWESLSRSLPSDSYTLHNLDGSVIIGSLGAFAAFFVLVFSFFRRSSPQNQAVPSVSRQATIAPAVSGNPVAKTNLNVPNTTDMETELKKLADLKSKGLIDDEEYKALKKKLLENA